MRFLLFALMIALLPLRGWVGDAMAMAERRNSSPEMLKKLLDGNAVGEAFGYYYDENGKVIVSVDPKYFRPAEVETLLGDSSKARNKMGWSPKIKFPELVREMAIADLESAKKDALLTDSGFKVWTQHE